MKFRLEHDGDNALLIVLVLDRVSAGELIGDLAGFLSGAPAPANPAALPAVDAAATRAAPARTSQRAVAVSGHGAKALDALLGTDWRQRFASMTEARMGAGTRWVVRTADGDDVTAMRTVLALVVEAMGHPSCTGAQREKLRVDRDRMHGRLLDRQAARDA